MEEVGKSLILTMEYQNKCVTMPQLALEKIVLYMIQNNISQYETVVTFKKGLGFNEMMEEASKFMEMLYLMLSFDLRTIERNSYLHGTLLCYKLQLEEPKVLDLMRFFKVDYSLNLSSKVIDNVTTIAIPDVLIDYVKK